MVSLKDHFPHQSSFNPRRGKLVVKNVLTIRNVGIFSELRSFLTKVSFWLAAMFESFEVQFFQNVVVGDIRFIVKMPIDGF